MAMKKTIIVIIVLCVVIYNAAVAQDSTHNILTCVGTVETLSLPQSTHIGLYLYGGVATTVAISQTVTLLPSMSVEWSPELGRWGFVATGTMDALVSKTLGLDVQILLVHDQPAWQFGEAMFYAGPGAGLSIYFGSSTISPSVNVLYGLSDGSWSLTPALNVSW